MTARKNYIRCAFTNGHVRVCVLCQCCTVDPDQCDIEKGDPGPPGPPGLQGELGQKGE